MPLKELRKDREERRVATFLFGGTMVMLLVLLYITFTNMRQYEDAVHEVRQDNLMLVEAEGMFAGLRDSEIGIRGFLLSGDSSFLVPYQEGLRSFQEHRARLSLHGMDGADSAIERRMAIRVKVLENQWRRLLAEPQPDRKADPRWAELLRSAKVAMDSLRADHRSLIERTERDRNASLLEESGEGGDPPFMLFTFSVLAMMPSVILFWRLSRTLRRTEEVRLALRYKVRDLDAEVGNRTRLQQLLQKVLDVSPSSIMSFKAVRDPNGQILDFEWLSSNTRANATLRRDDLVGKRLLQETPENGPSGLFDAYAMVVERDIDFVKEIHFKEDHIDTWFRAHAVKLEDGLMVTFTDITDQKRAEQVHIEADRLELTSQITRTVAHEVRNPLTNIQLALEQLVDEVDDRKELASPYAAIIERNVGRIGTLIKEMLESSRKHELKPVRCTVDDLIGALVRSVSDRLELRGMTAVVDVQPSLPDVLVDRDLIGLALTNIAVNAVEAMESKHGVLRLQAARDGHSVVLRIADNGRGISPENLQRLFEPFYSGRSGGLGLGLTTARSILRGHGVLLDVESAVGHGTTFTLRFPAQTLVPGS
ncbi:MAG: CHASE3 domain-containing protein [Flavobacteriales bacterium]|nr:CHASE3 domain-containing protein [Flavobacteriales bacterium]